MSVACGAIVASLLVLGAPGDPVAAPPAPPGPTVTLVADDEAARLDRIDLPPVDYVAQRRALKRNRERYGTPAMPTVAVCSPPCGVKVPAGHFYRIDGPGLTPSRDFVIPQVGPGEEVTVRTKTGSLALAVTGTTALVTGLVGVLVGGILVANESRDVSRAGLVTMGASAGVVALSFPLIFFGSTRVEVEKHAPSQ